LATVHYDVVALSVTIYFNKWGDHDHDGMMFALAQNKPRIDEYLAYLESTPKPSDAERTQHRFYPLIRPLVLRARAGDIVEVCFENRIRGREVGMHLVGGPYADGVAASDGAHVGQNPSSLAAFGQKRTYRWRCDNEGVFVFHDAGNLSGMQDGTNLHGLFGALVVEPRGTVWRDPETGAYVGEAPVASGSPGEEGPPEPWLGDGLYVDVVPVESRECSDPTPWTGP
jgi:manganese oxidase